MMSSEIKETIYIAITCILIASVLGIVAFVLDIRSDFASTRNLDIATQKGMSAYTEYNRYAGAVLYGEDVISLIRQYSDTDTSVYVDELYRNKDTNFPRNTGYYLNNNVVTISGGSSDEIYKDLSMAAIGSTTITGLDRERTYFSYLVFGEYDKESIIKAEYPKGDSTNLNYDDVTAIKVIYLTDGKKTEKEVETIIENKIGVR